MNTKVVYRIYGHPSRNEMANNLAEDLGIPSSEIYYDDRPSKGRCLYVLKKAMLAPTESDVTHICALPEDLELCNRFTDIINEIVDTHPSKIIGLFPFDYQSEGSVKQEFYSLNTPYIKVRILSCCGIVIPVKYISDCFTWIKNTYHDNIEDDIAIQHWAMHAGVDCITTIPSTIQHIGDVSLVTPNAPIRRTKYFEKNISMDVKWSSKDVYQPPKELTVFERYCEKGPDGLWRLKQV